MSTRPPKDVVEPHGSNAFALNDGNAGQPEKRLSLDVEKILEARRPSVIDTEMYPAPTDEERTTLRKVADSIPGVAYWLCAVEFAERASYYGVQGVFSNFMEFPLPPGMLTTMPPAVTKKLIVLDRWQWCRSLTARNAGDSRSFRPRRGVRECFCPSLPLPGVHHSYLWSICRGCPTRSIQGHHDRRACLWCGTCDHDWRCCSFSSSGRQRVGPVPDQLFLACIRCW